MGEYLNQCCNDAWDIIRGRKTMNGNNKELHESEYGWLAPDGKFYPVEFGKHQTWASKYILKLCREGYIPVEELRKAGSGDHVGDWLVNRGWVLIHNPTQRFTEITNNLAKRFTKSQKEFLHDYLYKRKRYKEAEEILED